MNSETQEQHGGGFGRPERFLAGLDGELAGKLIAAAADVVLIVDEDGVIQDMAFGSEELQGHGYQGWLGKPWQDTVTVESQPKVLEMLRTMREGTASVRWRHVNHPTADGADLPLSYSLVPFKKPEGAPPADADPRRHAVAFGRDLRSQVTLQQRLVSAQVSMERDYWRLRHVETRYRLLFQQSSEAVLIMNAETERLEEANPAAYKLLGDRPRRSNWQLSESLQEASRADVQDLFARLRTNGRADPVTVRLLEQDQPVQLVASMFRQENASHFLVRLTPPELTAESADVRGNQLMRIMEMAPDAFVITDLEGRIIAANRTFLDLAQLPNEEMARGELIDRWLGRAGVDLSVLLSNLRQHGVVRLYATRLRGDYGSTAEVEISAVSVVSGDTPCLGFTIRDIGRRLEGEAKLGKDLPRSAGQMTDLVGRVPLRDIVRETTDLIEQLCIEAALELTNDNRVSAAEMLGLSRQSLYVKLRRFGIGDLGSDAPGT